MTSKEYHGDKRERSLDMIKRVERMATMGSPELADSIHEKTQKEVQKGTMDLTPGKKSTGCLKEISR